MPFLVTIQQNCGDMIQLAHIEDDSDIREIVQLALSLESRFKVTPYVSGEAALDGITDAPPDVILLDVMMPGIDGYQTLDALRAMPAISTVPVIFMTAYVTDPQLAKWCKEPDVDVIEKPIDPLRLGEQIDACLHNMRMNYA